MVSWYSVCNVELPNPGKFPYPGFIQGFIHNLIPGLPYPGKFPYSGKSTYPVKASIRKSIYFSKAIITQSRNYQV